MDKQKAVLWATGQDVVKVRAIREGEEDKFILTVGQYNVTPIVFDTREQAETFLEAKLNLTNLDLAVIGAMWKRLDEISKQGEPDSKYEEQPKNEEQ